MSHHLIYMTAANRDSAMAVARVLVEHRLVACANVIDGATSLYWWEGKVAEEREAVMIAKTTAENVSKTFDKIREMHEYSCPCAVALEIADGLPAFLEWITAETVTAG